MKSFASLIAFIFIASSHAFTNYNSKGYRSNVYNSYSTGKSKTYRGYNTTTGRSWSQTNTGSSYYGTDSRGNFYQGNSKSGYYYNSGTGKTCYGKGLNRTCY